MSTPSHLLTELIHQHDVLRAMMDRCEQLADDLDAERGDPVALTREVAKLRIAFTTHNQFEEKLLRPVLAEQDAFGAVRIAHMVNDHVAEHRAMANRLGGPSGELRGVVASLRAHLEAEERYFLTSKVLRDDLISLEGGG